MTDVSWVPELGYYIAIVSGSVVNVSSDGITWMKRDSAGLRFALYKLKRKNDKVSNMRLAKDFLEQELKRELDVVLIGGHDD